MELVGHGIRVNSLTPTATDPSESFERAARWGRTVRKPESLDEFVFATDSGRPRDKDSVRERVLVPVVNRVNEIRTERGIAPLPKITPHALRRLGEAAGTVPSSPDKPSGGRVEGVNILGRARLPPSRPSGQALPPIQPRRGESV